MALASSMAATVGIGAGLSYADNAASSVVVSTQAATLPAATAAPTTAAAATTTASNTATTAAATTASTAAAASGSAWVDGSYTGTAEYTKWGDVQVAVTIQGGQIVAVQEVQAPSDGKSQAINGRAAPTLESEAVAAQSADIDAVSGATYTSVTYKTSLQAALDQAASAAATVG